MKVFEKFIRVRLAEGNLPYIVEVNFIGKLYVNTRISGSYVAIFLVIGL